MVRPSTPHKHCVRRVSAGHAAISHTNSCLARAMAATTHSIMASGSMSASSPSLAPSPPSLIPTEPWPLPSPLALLPACCRAGSAPVPWPPALVGDISLLPASLGTNPSPEGATETLVPPRGAARAGTCGGPPWPCGVANGACGAGGGATAFAAGECVAAATSPVVVTARGALIATLRALPRTQQQLAVSPRARDVSQVILIYYIPNLAG